MVGARFKVDASYFRGRLGLGRMLVLLLNRNCGRPTIDVKACHDIWHFLSPGTMSNAAFIKIILLRLQMRLLLFDIIRETLPA